MTAIRKYQEQFDRVKRWYERFRKIDQGISHEKSSEEYTDNVYAFFQNCYYLKDWIKNDITINQNVRDQVENFIRQNACLSLCADICNGLKHLKFDQRHPPRTGSAPEFESRNYSLTLGGSQPKLQIKWSIKTSTGKRDAFQLATECVQKWEEFFIKNNLN